MPGQTDSHSFSRVAAADLRTSQFRCIKIDTNGEAARAAAATDVILGILQNKPNVDEAANVLHLGISKGVAGAAYTTGQELTSDSTGRLVAASTTQMVVAIALEGGGAADEIHEVFVVSTYSKA